MTAREALAMIKERLSSVSDEAAAEARLIVSAATGLPAGLLRLEERALTPEEEGFIVSAVERRLRREPLQYVLGEWSFMGLDFFVSPAALIPRQDTETLCEEALRLIAERKYRSMLDICTGTGCIATAVKRLAAEKGREISVEASDISPDAVALAKKNAEKNGVGVDFRCADLFGGAGKYDLITANPPYIPDEDMEKLAPELAFEPRLALCGGEDGLDLYRRIAAEAEEHILPGGALLLEVGAGEAEAVVSLFPERETAVTEDLNGVRRVVRIDF